MKAMDKQKVFDWRVERLEQMGFTKAAAKRLAEGTSDLHAIQRALDSGGSHPAVYRTFR